MHSQEWLKDLPLKYYFIFFLCLLLYSCHTLSEKRNKEIWSMIKSNNVDSIVNGTIEIQKAKNTTMLEAILYKPNDPRITHLAFQKGMSVYQIKMTALKVLIGISPPNKITYKVDTSIINFYKQKIKLK